MPLGARPGAVGPDASDVRRRQRDHPDVVAAALGPDMGGDVLGVRDDHVGAPQPALQPGPVPGEPRVVPVVVHDDDGPGLALHQRGVERAFQRGHHVVLHHDQVGLELIDRARGERRDAPVRDERVGTLGRGEDARALELAVGAGHDGDRSSLPHAEVAPDACVLRDPPRPSQSTMTTLIAAPARLPSAADTPAARAAMRVRCRCPGSTTSTRRRRACHAITIGHAISSAHPTLSQGDASHRVAGQQALLRWSHVVTPAGVQHDGVRHERERSTGVAEPPRPVELLPVEEVLLRERHGAQQLRSCGHERGRCGRDGLGHLGAPPLLHGGASGASPGTGRRPVRQQRPLHPDATRGGECPNGSLVGAIGVDEARHRDVGTPEPDDVDEPPERVRRDRDIVVGEDDVLRRHHPSGTVHGRRVAVVANVDDRDGSWIGVFGDDGRHRGVGAHVHHQHRYLGCVRERSEPTLERVGSVVGDDHDGHVVRPQRRLDDHARYPAGHGWSRISLGSSSGSMSSQAAKRSG